MMAYKEGWSEEEINSKEVRGEWKAHRKDESEMDGSR